MSWLDECEQEANLLPQDKRQQFMDLIHQGKTIGDARKEADVSFNAANGIIRMNIAEMKWLRKESL